MFLNILKGWSKISIFNLLKNKWKITVIETGSFKLDGGAMMGSVPKVLWEKTNPADSLNRIDLSMRCLLLDNGTEKILIETGIGNKNSEKFNKIFSISQSAWPIKDKLKEFGYNVNDITHVIITHLHFDHAGGATIFNGEETVPTFPNAQYIISKTNWDSALNPSPKDRASYLIENFMPLEDAGQVKLVDDNENLLNGINGLAFYGHTYGQQLIKISNKQDTLIFCADLIPLKSHLQIPWVMGYDLYPMKTLDEKTKLLNQAAENNWILFFYHDPKSIAVRIKKSDKYYEIVEELKVD